MIGEIGAGIQMGPNLTRLLIRLGLGKRLAVKPEGLVFERWCAGETAAWSMWGDTMEEECGAPCYHIHVEFELHLRSDFHRMVLELAEPHRTIRMNCRVVSMDTSKPTLTLESGDGLVISADGLQRPLSRQKSFFKTQTSDPWPKNSEMVGWIGLRRHIMGYNIRGQREYGLVVARPDGGGEESWTATGSAGKMRAEFAGWELRPPETWIHKDGKLVLLGDLMLVGLIISV
ncbi:hypothetical protein DEU56DRAFT_959171 [Suillus clintonianus]|uniref:uncharacterized protein n=1 Tax=Suillus clintonianus TaxID=1904413 RepID=UPI001B87D88A|nr:uncharacterized protein DEU56DRAFT_959171 [Suillus clintonianus]KAG2126807.1 hypothetical protein DEU56DRAFT_959171 [Suillus clintonianus]